ncbi:MAG: SDR family NAD(P)-dependent oxidoreductase [Pseudomonadales bacterium]
MTQAPDLPCNELAIIGGTGGIGRALLDWYATHRPDARIWASHRPGTRPPTTGAGAVTWVPLDLQQDTSVTAFCQRLNDAGAALDLLLICSGWLHDAQFMPEKSLRDLNGEQLTRALRINASAPLLITAGLSEALSRSAARSGQRPRVIALSAKVGSISDNSLGGWHAYRMSKAALNMGVRNLGIEFARSKRKPLIAAVHPGTTDTALSEPFAKRGLAVVSAEIAAERLSAFAEQMSDRHQGGLFHWDGTAISW